MKRQFTATVVGISPTTTSDFNGGAHTVTMALDAQGPCAPISKNVELPLFSVEDARVLGPLYRVHHAVLVTFETSEAPEPEKVWATGFVQVGVLNGSESDARSGNRPWCCAAARDAEEVLWIRHGKWVIGDSGANREICFCPFCGKKLPEVA